MKYPNKSTAWKRVEFLTFTKGEHPEYVVADIIRNHGLQGLRVLLCNPVVTQGYIIDYVDTNTLFREVVKASLERVFISTDLTVGLYKKLLKIKSLAWLEKNKDGLRVLYKSDIDRHVVQDYMVKFRTELRFKLNEGAPVISPVIKFGASTRSASVR